VTTSAVKKVTVQAQNVNQCLWLKRSKSVQYEEQDYFSLLEWMSVRNVAAEDASTLLEGVPSGDALLQQLKKFGVEEVEGQFNAVFARQYQQVLGKKKRQPRVVAIIDVHEQETYTKEKRTSPDIKGGKHKNGTNFFFKFVTIQLLYKKRVVTLKVHLQRRGEHLRDVVDALVRHALKYVQIEMLLLDRGFRDVTILNQLEYLHVPILMPAVMDEKAKTSLANMLRFQRSCRFSLCNKHHEYADVKLLKVHLPNGKTIGFYTTRFLPWLRTPRYYLRLYAKRWTIETGYRVQNQFLAKTTCIKGQVRLFYFSYAVALHNLWLWLRTRLQPIKFTVTRMKLILEHTHTINLDPDTS